MTTDLQMRFLPVSRQRGTGSGAKVGMRAPGVARPHDPLLHGRTWRELLPLILFAGLSGGAAEIAWVALYGYVTPLSAHDVSREIVVTLFPAAASSAASPALGVAIHLALSLLLALAFAWLVWLPTVKRFGLVATLPTAVAALTVVWAMNFFVVLPVVNPAFASLMPYSVTFVSKLLFGVALAAVLHRGGRRHLALRRGS